MKKKKVIISFIMLLITAIALTTAGYAWFTANTKVELGGLDVNVQASNGIQISVNGSNWQSTLTTEELKAASYTGSTNQFPANPLSPVSTAGLTTNGKLDMYLGELNDDGSINLTKQTDAQGTEGKYIAFDLFVRATSANSVKLLDTSNVSAYKVVGDTLSDKGLKYSARVAFVNLGVASDNNFATAAALNTTSPVVNIWEPNADQHTANAIGSGSVAGTKYSYLGAKAAGENITINDSNYFSAATTLQSNVGAVPTGEMFSVNPGINKIRIYIWIEGQDVDCENSASLGSGIRVLLNLNAE